MAMDVEQQRAVDTLAVTIRTRHDKDKDAVAVVEDSSMKPHAADTTNMTTRTGPPQDREEEGGGGAKEAEADAVETVAPRPLQQQQQQQQQQQGTSSKEAVDDDDALPPVSGEGKVYDVSELFTNPNLQRQSAKFVFSKDPFCIPRATDNVRGYRPRFNPLSILVAEEKLLPRNFCIDLSEGIPGLPKPMKSKGNKPSQSASSPSTAASSSGSTASPSSSSSLPEDGDKGTAPPPPPPPLAPAAGREESDSTRMFTRSVAPSRAPATFGDKLSTMGMMMGTLPRQQQSSSPRATTTMAPATATATTSASSTDVASPALQEESLLELVATSDPPLPSSATVATSSNGGSSSSAMVATSMEVAMATATAMTSLAATQPASDATAFALGLDANGGVTHQQQLQMLTTSASMDARPLPGFVAPTSAIVTETSSMDGMAYMHPPAESPLGRVTELGASFGQLMNYLPARYSSPMASTRTAPEYFEQGYATPYPSMHTVHPQHQLQQQPQSQHTFAQQQFYLQQQHQQQQQKYSQEYRQDPAFYAVSTGMSMEYAHHPSHPMHQQHPQQQQQQQQHAQPTLPPQPLASTMIPPSLQSQSPPTTMGTIPKKSRSKNVFRPCSAPGCTKGARGKSGLCQKHGGGKRCATPNCPKGAQGSSSFCLSHGGGYRCTAPGCMTGARGTSGLCAKHGGYKRGRGEEDGGAEGSTGSLTPTAAATSHQRGTHAAKQQRTDVTPGTNEV